jgi:hypothetical protein
MGLLFDLKLGVEKGAIISSCRMYRYQLRRVWDDDLPYLNVIGLNPSTADEAIDDPTIRRCVDYARRWGYGALYMTNLFAWRATKPAAMKKAIMPVGEQNDRWLATTATNAGLVLAAWGIHGSFRARDVAVLDLLASRPIYCLRKTKGGLPEHPLFLPKTLKPLLYQASKARKARAAKVRIE